MVIGDCRLGLWGGHGWQLAYTTATAMPHLGRPRWGPGKLMELVGELFAKWRLESEAETGAQELGGSAPGLLQDLEHEQQQGPVSGGTKPVPGPGEPAACRDCDGTWM